MEMTEGQAPVVAREAVEVREARPACGTRAPDLRVDRVLVRLHHLEREFLRRAAAGHLAADMYPDDVRRIY